jgi:hypothetical protein
MGKKLEAKEIQKYLDEGYSFRFNSFVEEDVIHVMSEEQLEEYSKILKGSKIATVAYKHRYLCYLMEYGWEEGLDKCMEFANDQIDVFVYKEMLKLGYGYTYTREEAKEIDNKQYKAW